MTPVKAGPSGSTPNLGLPYPTPDDTVEVPRDLKALADRLDVELGGGGAGGGVVVAKPVLDVGVLGQVRAGRQLTLADFTSLGLSAPAGLWNLSDLSDASGNARALTNKGAVALGAGINGLAATSAQFTGSAAQALYIADTGAADAFRVRTGSWGCWFKTAKRGVAQVLVSKWSPGIAGLFVLYVNSTNQLQSGITTDGNIAGGNVFNANGVSDVGDDRWHFAVATVDGTTHRLYVDGLLEGSIAAGAIYNTTAPAFNIGGNGADGAAGTQSPHYGRVDEAFVTADVLSDEQVRLLYAARAAHNLGVTPRSASVHVTRQRKGAALAPADFTTPPLRLHNFTASALTDQGSGNVPLVNNAAAFAVAGADGGLAGAFGFTGTQSLTASDAGLPAAVAAARSYGCWFKTSSLGAALGIMGWGTGGARALIATGVLRVDNAADGATGPFVADGLWHALHVVEDNTASDGVRRKVYLDGRLVATSTVMGTFALAGAGGFTVGKDPAGNFYVGQIDGVFICAYALDASEIARLYAKGSQALGASPKNAGDHVERMDATSVLAIFDTLDTQHVVALGVSA